jgi:hypothetical protein
MASPTSKKLLTQWLSKIEIGSSRRVSVDEPWQVRGQDIQHLHCILPSLAHLSFHRSVLVHDCQPVYVITCVSRVIRLGQKIFLFDICERSGPIVSIDMNNNSTSLKVCGSEQRCSFLEICHFRWLMCYLEFQLLKSLCFWKRFGQSIVIANFRQTELASIANLFQMMTTQ